MCSNIQLYNGDCLNVMDTLIKDGVNVDAIITSPPYDDMRTYNGTCNWSFDIFKHISEKLFCILKDGGVIVWVVADKTVDGSETGTSFKQALYFKDIGLNLHDTMIYKKKNTPFMRSNAYTNCFEFMFVFSKGKPKTFHPIKEPTVRSGKEMLVYNKKADGVNRKVLKELKTEKTKTNIWEYAVGLGGSTNDKIAFKHPAIFPEKLVRDHIISWTNKDDFVLDPFMGSGTTGVACKLLGRKFIGIELDENYFKVAEQRIHNTVIPKKLF